MRSCNKCNDEHYILLGCCNGHECGCMGQPVSMINCDKCNPDGDKAMGGYVKKYADKVEYAGTRPPPETVSLNLPLSINIDDMRNQIGSVTAAHDREILYQSQINDLSSVIDLLDDILEKTINIKQQRGKNAK